MEYDFTQKAAKRVLDKGKKAVEKRTEALKVLSVEYVDFTTIKPNSYNPNRQTADEFELLLRSMHEDGFCVSSDTPVLCADLVWRSAGDLRVGDPLVAFDEHPDPNANCKHGRRFRTATVTHNSLRKDKLYKVKTERGDVRCNAEHPWLVRRDRKGPMPLRGVFWVKTRDLVVGDTVVHVMDPWVTDTSWDSGWLAGFMDGEGSMVVNACKGSTNIHRLAIYQRPGPTADLLIKLMQQRVDRLKVRIDSRTASNPKWSDMVTVRVDSLSEIMRTLGSVRPPRLLEAGGRFWEGRSIAVGGSGVEVLAIEDAGFGEIASLSTSTHTYIAGGFAMHNTQPVVVSRVTKEIVDGEHRWRAAQALGINPIPVVFVDYTPEQMRIATLRHNRARGNEELEFTAQVIRELEQLGAIDWAKESLMMSDEEIGLLLEEVKASEELAVQEFSQAWDPSKTGTESEQHFADASTAISPVEISGGAAGVVTMAASLAAANHRSQAQAIIQSIEDPVEREEARKQAEIDTYRIQLLFIKDEATIVRGVLGDHPAEKLLEVCRPIWEAQEEIRLAEEQRNKEKLAVVREEAKRKQEEKKAKQAEADQERKAKKAEERAAKALQREEEKRKKAEEKKDKSSGKKDDTVREKKPRKTNGAVKEKTYPVDTPGGVVKVTRQKVDAVPDYGTIDFSTMKI